MTKQGSTADSYKGFLNDIGQASPQAAADVTSVAYRVRTIRKAKGLTIEDVAQRTGLSTDYLAQIERDETSAPLGVLVKLARALHMKLGRFISNGDSRPFTVVRKDQRRIVSRHTSTQRKQYGYTYESLAPDKKDRFMEPFIVTLAPTEAKKELSSHAGQEFIHVLEGAMQVFLEDYTDVLYPGDSLYYESTVPHQVRCYGDKETVILAVLYIEEK